MELSNMIIAMVEFYFVNRDEKQLARFAKTDNVAGLLELLQYVLDGMPSAITDTVLLDTASGNYIKAHKVAEYFGMRKRTSDERMKNATTYNLNTALISYIPAKNETEESENENVIDD